MSATILVAGLGLILPREAMRKIEQKIDIGVDRTIRFPVTSLDPIEVQSTNVATIKAVLTYHDAEEDKLFATVIATHTHRFLTTTRALEDSSYYSGLDEEERKELDKRVRFYIKHIRKQEGIDRMKAAAASLDPASDTTVDLAEEEREELAFTEEEITKQNNRIRKLTKSIQNVTTLQEDFSLKDAQAKLVESNILQSEIDKIAAAALAQLRHINDELVKN